MKKTLLSLLLGFAFNLHAQIHPASIWSMTSIYNAPANHTQEVWTIMGFSYYTINITRGAGNYISATSSSTQAPLTADQYKTTSGTKTGNVYTAITQRSIKGLSTYRDWRRDTWQSDGTNDTLLMWEDYDTLASVWKNVAKNSLTYSGNQIQVMTGYSWNTTTSAWVNASKNEFTYVSGQPNKINFFNWDIATSAWVEGGYMQYFFTGSKLDSMQQWAKDVGTSAPYLKYRFMITSNADNKTAAFQQYQWKASTGVWEASINIAFTGGSTGLEANENASHELIYPNPAIEYLTIDLKSIALQNAILRLYSLDGKEVLQLPISEDQTSIQTGTLSNGVYFLQVENKGELLHQQKIMVAH